MSQQPYSQLGISSDSGSKQFSQLSVTNVPPQTPAQSILYAHEPSSM